MRKQRLTEAELAREELKLELKKAQNALDSAYSIFENVTDPDLIDCAIYQINAIQLRYKYLLEYAKKYIPEEINGTSGLPITLSPSNTDIYKYSELIYE
ncbi:MAG: YaaL family protein [Lachnospiraceae bacterium]|nr:YaaL family protein [Lachnospiraceae bacterium]